MYPEEIYLDEDRQQALKTFLLQELTFHYMEREQWIQQLIRYQQEYWAEPATKKLTFPFTGASTLIIPLTAIAVETVHARDMTTLFGINQFTDVKAKNKDWSDIATPVQRFLDHELLNVMGIYKPMQDINLDRLKYGTCVSKVVYERLVKYAVRRQGGEDVEFPVVIKNGAQLYGVPIGKFLMRFDSHDITTAHWCGEEHSDTIYEIELKEQSGLFRKGTTDALRSWVTRSTAGTTGVERKMEKAQDVSEERSPAWPQFVDWVELHMAFDVDGSEHQREIIVCYHRTAEYIMSIRNNTSFDLHRPYDKSVYFPVEYRWTGIGICKQNESFQNEITTQHRQRLDNATIAGMRMLKVAKSAGFNPDEDIFPGKMWFVDSMEDIEAFEFGEIYTSAFQDEQASLIYSQQRTGVNEINLGMPQVGTPGTATGDLARIQEGNKKFDFTYKNLKEHTGEIVNKVALEIQQYGPRDISYFSVSDGGKEVQQFFTLPSQYIKDGLMLQIGSAGAQQNKIIDRQNAVQVVGMLQQYYMSMLQLAQGLQDQQLTMQIAKQGLVAATEMMRQVLESFDYRNIDKIIVMQLLQPMRDKMIQAIGGGQQGDQPQGLIAPPGGNAPPVDNTASTLASLTQLLQTIGKAPNGAVNSTV